MEQGNREKLTGELYMSINAYFQIPKSETKGRKLAMKNSVIRPTKRPDIDNIIKIIADSLNKLAYGDDSQIVAVAANKFYTEDNPRVEVEIIDIK